MSGYSETIYYSLGSMYKIYRGPPKMTFARNATNPSFGPTPTPIFTGSAGSNEERNQKGRQEVGSIG